MQRDGIQVHLTESPSVEEALEEFELDLLATLHQEQTCSGGHGFGRTGPGNSRVRLARVSPVG
jgi:hypothetical protein